MLKRIRTLLQSSLRSSKSRIDSDGFIYVTETETTALRGVSVGATVRNTNAGPPWIVVNHSLAAVLVSRWPGRLLRVKILEKAKEQPMAYANYTRAIAVLVVEELPAFSLLGEHGALLAEILGRISTLTLDEALALSAALQPPSREIYSAVWKNWLTKVEGNSAYLDTKHEDTLQIKVGHEVSPVGYALSLVSSMILNRGQAVSGPAAITVDAEGDVELQLPWSGAATALLHATMAYGAPGLLTLGDAVVLKFPWDTVMREPIGC
jgi:hypothetical protein